MRPLSEAASPGTVVASFARQPRVTASVHERLIDQRLEHLAVVGAYRAWSLCHVDADDLFPRIDPKEGAAVTAIAASIVVASTFHLDMTFLP